METYIGNFLQFVQIWFEKTITSSYMHPEKHFFHKFSVIKKIVGSAICKLRLAWWLQTKKQGRLCREVAKMIVVKST